MNTALPNPGRASARKLTPYIAVLRRLSTITGLGHSTVAALVCVVATESGSMTMGDLAAALGVKTAGATPLADNLEAAGLCLRVRTRDRRVILLQATDKGRALFV